MKNSNDFFPAEKKKVLIVEDQFSEAYDLDLILRGAGYEVLGIAKSVDEALILLDKDAPDLVLLDIKLAGALSGIDLARILQKRQIGFIYISANSSKEVLDEAKTTQPYGFLIKPFREQDLLTTLEIAFYRHQYSLDSWLLNQKEMRLQIDAITVQPNWDQSLLQLARIIQTYVPFNYMDGGFAETPDYNIFGLFRKHYEEYKIVAPEDLAKLAEVSRADLDQLHRNSTFEYALGVTSGDGVVEACRTSAIKRIVTNSFRLMSYLTIPLEIEGKKFVITLYSRRTESFDNNHLSLFTNIKENLEGFIRRHFSQQNALLSNETAEEVLEVDEPLQFEGMIGDSNKMMVVFDYIKKVAPLDISVLVLGENGTGKEKVAQSIHNLSKRREMPFVVVNCGAVPENLAESILFGHEKGAFTGATEKRTGKFEMAEGGTIFLDEIGDMSPEIQVKLLRVLQEKEIDRLGAKAPIKTDVRIIAATNKDLVAEVAAGRFRMDLYYRLYVFPITVPALRDRKEDIAPLVIYFCKHYSELLGRKPAQFSNEALNLMLNYQWPGNIRELEHFVQRSLLLSDEAVIRDIELPGMDFTTVKPDTIQATIKTINENEREYIVSVLQQCNWKVFGVGGAAALLGLHPSTLNSKMKKLSIHKRQ